MRKANGLADKQDALVGQTTDRGYTEHEHLDEVGAIHMNGRVYDPLVGRFMSADPFVQAPYDLRSFNRYAYVWNNPLKNFDPSGYWVNCYDGGDGFQCSGLPPGFGNGNGGNGAGNGCQVNCTGGATTPGTGGSTGNLVGGLGAGAGATAGLVGNNSYTNSICGVVQCAGTNLQMGLYQSGGTTYIMTPQAWLVSQFLYGSGLNTGPRSAGYGNGVLVAGAGGALSGMYGRLIWGSGAAGAAGNQGSTGSSGYDYVNDRPADNDRSIGQRIYDGLLELGKAIADILTTQSSSPPQNAYDPNGPKAPGKPSADDGFIEPKGGDKWSPNPNGRGYGWEDRDGNVWVPTGQGGGAHGGPHWDVQGQNGRGLGNRYPGGKFRPH